MRTKIMVQHSLLLLILIIGCVTSDSNGNNENDDAHGVSENPIDADLSEETGSAIDAVTKYLGFSCSKGHRLLPVFDCLPCDYGTYKDNEGSGLCIRCPPDCTTLRKGAQSREECVPFCPPGYELSACDKTCTKCRPGTYKPNWEKNTPCLKCPDDSNAPLDAIGMDSESQCYVDTDDPTVTTTAPSPMTSADTTATEVDCTELPCTLPHAVEVDLCGPSVKQYFTCLHFCSGNPFAELYGDVSGFTSELRSQIVHQIEILSNDDGWPEIYAWYLSECQEDDTAADPTATEQSPVTSQPQTPVPTSTDTFGWTETRPTSSPMTSRVTSASKTECPALPCALPHTSDVNLCSSSVKQYFTCLAGCSPNPFGDLNDDYSKLISELKSQLVHQLNTANGWLEIYAWYLKECTDDEYETESTEATSATLQPPSSPPTLTGTCQDDTQCGIGGACYDSKCGCLTANCSGVAYAALPDCQWYCHCDDATNTWKKQRCNAFELFDEKIDNCNWNHTVRKDICSSVSNCDSDDCVFPTVKELCSYDVRKYMTCLRSLYVQCDRSPATELQPAFEDIDPDLYDRLMTSDTVKIMQQVYYDYMRKCFADV